MNRTKVLLASSAVFLTLLSPPSLAAQADADVVKLLTDSIGRLNTVITTARADLVNASLPYPTAIISTEKRVADSHAYFRVVLNDPARVLIRVRREGSANIEEGRSMDLKTEHSIRVNNLVPEKNYTADVIVLQNDAAATEGSLHQTGRTGVAGWPSIPALRFPTLPQITPPNLTLPNGPPTNPASPPTVTLNVRSSQPALIRGEVYLVTNGIRAETPADIDGQEFTLDDFGRPTAVETAFSGTRVLTFTGLEPSKVYMFRVRAMNREGATNVLSVNPGGFDQLTTGIAVPEFGFSGPLAVKIRPTEGLVVEWGSTVPAVSGGLRAQFNNIPGAILSTPGVPVPDNPLRMRATIPLANLAPPMSSAQGDAPPPVPPVVTVQMTSATGLVRTLDFTLALELPQSKAAIDNAGPGVLTSQQRNAMKRVWDGLQNSGKNVNWGDVGVTALKFLGAGFIP